MDWKVEDKPETYFQTTYASHVYSATTTWGDVYRMHKYYRLFSSWDGGKGGRLYMIYPNQLSET